MRLDPESVTASPEKKSLVAAIERAIVARRLEAWRRCVDGREIEAHAADLASAVETGAIPDPQVPGKMILLTVDEFVAVKRMLAATVYVMGGELRVGPVKWVSDDGEKVQCRLP